MKTCWVDGNSQIEGVGEDAPGIKGGTAMLAELNNLWKENKRLKMERKILKKAAPFFAKEMSRSIDLLMLRRRSIR
jgi:hypothetical protein